MDRSSVVTNGLADLVVGVLDREHLSAALVALHRAGFGAHARVFDPVRGDLRGQLNRANLVRFVAVDALPPEAAVVAVVAPGRTATVADTLLRHGARDVRAVARSAVEVGHGVPPVEIGPIVATDAPGNHP